MTERHLEHTLFGEDERHHQHPHLPHFGRMDRPPRRRGRRLLVLVLALAVVAGAGYAAYGVLRPMVANLTQGNDYSGPGTGSVKFVVNDGDTGRVIAKNLADQGVVKTAKAFLDAAAKNPRSAGIQPGSYPLKKQMTASAALAVLVDPGSRKAPGVTIREGLWASEIYPLLAKATGTPLADYTSAVRHPAALGLPAAAKGNVEGYLFPSTYDFPAKATAVDQLSMMVQRTKDELVQAGVSDAGMERTVIVASIIEGEVSGKADRSKVARVIENRLSTTGETRGLLQLNSTVQYALQKRGKVLNSTKELAVNSRYNTYKYRGLPPGPIGNPGAASIEAAAHPAAGPWYFFVTVDPGTGRTVFVRTLAEQRKNQAILQQWCKAHPGTC